LGEVENEFTLHNSIVLDIFVPNTIKFGGNMTKLWQKHLTVFWDLG